MKDYHINSNPFQQLCDRALMVTLRYKLAQRIHTFPRLMG